MAKILAADLDPNVSVRARGRFFVAQTVHGAIAKKWPRKRGRARTEAQRFLEEQFGYAARMAANSEPIQFATAVNLTRNTELMPRDLLMKAIYGRAYEIVLPDGTVLVPADHTLPTTSPDEAFMGAMLSLTTGKTVTAPGFNVLSWDQTVYEEGTWWDPAQPTRLTVPAGTAFVRAAAGLEMNGSPGNNCPTEIRKNGLFTYPGASGFWRNFGLDAAAVTPVIAVVPGDYLELYFQPISFTRTVQPVAGSFFSIERVG